VINHNSVIGDNVSLKHSTTIGCKTDVNNHCIKQAIIGNNVIIHPHSCIIGLEIGDNVIVGAGSIGVKDAESNTIVAGNPAKLIRILEKE
jgi:putative colanic acid biosynthesis acetyltransferase WcaB